MHNTHILLMGPPAAGKGTVSQFLCQKGRYSHLCLGDILRGEVRDETALGLECKSYLDSGQLIPTALGIKIFEENFFKAEAEEKWVIADGLVQNEEYARYFKGFFAERKVSYVYLSASQDVCMHRILERSILQKREDDSNTDAIYNRLDRFFQKSIHLVDLFRGEPTFVEIDANRVLIDVKEDIERLFCGSNAAESGRSVAITGLLPQTSSLTH